MAPWCSRLVHSAAAHSAASKIELHLASQLFHWPLSSFGWLQPPSRWQRSLGLSGHQLRRCKSDLNWCPTGAVTRPSARGRHRCFSDRSAAAAALACAALLRIQKEAGWLAARTQQRDGQERTGHTVATALGSPLQAQATAEGASFVLTVACAAAAAAAAYPEAT